MRVAVITASHKPRPEWLRQCHESVRAQTHPCLHILVADGGACEPPPGFEGQFINLQHHHNDSGDTPRSIGALSALAQGFDAVSWLDDDNWYYPERVARLVAVQQRSRAAICTCTQDIYTLDDRRLGPSRDIDGAKFVDTNCYLLTRAAAGLLPVWATMPVGWHVCGDIYFFDRVKRSGLPRAHLQESLVGYRATRSHLYRAFGEEPPPGVKDSEAIWRELVRQGLVQPRKAAAR